MFEFTREFILNSTEGVVFEGNVLRVPKMINIEAGKVHSIHSATYMPAKNEVVTIPVKDLKGALTITIGQEGRVISLVSSRDAENQKDYIFNGTPADWARQFARQAAMEDMDRLIDIEVKDDNMTIKALDCYTRVLKVTLVADKLEDGKVVGEEIKEWSRKAYWQNEAGFAVKQTLSGVTFIPGTEGMGTVARLQKNNRVLTAANITPYGFDRDERPVPGGKYHQYTIQYVSERRHQTAGVFGAIDHSLVTLVFFVEDSVRPTWAGQLAQLAEAAKITICKVGTDANGDQIPGQPTAAEEKAPVVEAKEEIVPSKKHKE